MRYRQSVRSAMRCIAFCCASGMLAPTPFLVAAHAQSALSQGDIAVTLNGAPIDFGGVAPTQVSGRVLVPLRGVFEALGATVNFDPATSQILAVQGNNQIELRLGSIQATVNGVLRVLDIPAQSRAGRTFVPLRFVSETLGADVRWNNLSRTVEITSRPVAATPPQPAPTDLLPPVPVAPAPIAPVAQAPAAVVPPPYTAPPYNAPLDTHNDVHQVLGTVVKVDTAPPPTITLARPDQRPHTYNAATNLQLFRQVARVVATTAAPVYGTPIAVADISLLVPGEDVRAQLNDDGDIIRLTSLAMMATAHVRYTQDNLIVLEDTRGTTLAIGPSLRYLDARGRSVPAAALQPGQTVALFIAPSTRRIYQVSTFAPDITAANAPGAVTADNNPIYPPQDNTPPDTTTAGPADAAGAPTINLVQHSAVRPLRTASTLTVTVRGTPGARGSFTVIQGAPEQALTEDPNQPGVYSGTYLVRPGDNLLNGRVTAYLRNDAGQEAVLQSRAALTIDTVAPRILSVTPADGAQVTTAQPNIVVAATDLGGSGLARATASINNMPVPVDSITIAPNAVTVIPPQPLTGPTTVRVSIADAANNSVVQIWNFTAGAGLGGNLITSVMHNGTRALAAGERVTVNVIASEGGRATFDVLGDNQRIVAQRLPMVEVSPGHYRGYHTIQPNLPDAQLFIRARFTDAEGRTDMADALAPVQLADVADMQPVAVTLPLDGDHVNSPLTVRGTATPNATVEVSVRAEGTRYFIFEYKNELGTQQVQANARGEWVTQPVDLPRPNNVSNLRYVITTVQVDAAGRRSDPIVVNVDSK